MKARLVRQNFHGTLLRTTAISASVATALCALPQSYVLAQAANPSLIAASQTYAFNIPAQPLPQALNEFGRKTGLTVIFTEKGIGAITSQPVQQRLTASQALSALLGGTGVTYRFTNARTVTIERPLASNDFMANAGDSLQLDMIDVHGGESAYGPVTGYRATRTATATKTDTPLRDVPQSIQIVPRDLITDRQETSLTGAVETVSGVRQSSTAGNRAETFLIRGFSTPSYAIDGVMLNPTGDRPETFLDLANVERVEVLKGPASAIYGRGQPGGLINIVTKRPTDTYTGELNNQIGSFSFGRVEGTMSGPVTADKTLSMRVTGAGQTQSGFRFIGTRSDRQFGSLALRYAPLEATEINFSYDHTAQQLPFDRGLIVSADNKVDLPRDRVLVETWSRSWAYKDRLNLRAEHKATDWLSLRAVVRYDEAKVQDTGIDFRDLQSNGRTLTRRYTDRIEHSRNFDTQLEGLLKFDTGWINHNTLVGFEYSNAQMDFISSRANIASIDIYNPVYGAVRPAATLNSDYVNTIRMASGYVQDQITFSPQWKMMAGLRYDTVAQEGVQNVGAGDPNYYGNALTGRVGIVYQPIEPISIYASFSQSFVPQSGITINGGALGPEKGDQIEVGIKADLIPDQLSLTASLFNINKRNVATSDPNNPNADYQLQTGRQQVRGGEVDVTGTVLPGWQVVASFSYLDARIAEDETLQVGNRLTGVPTLSGAFWTTYDFQTAMLKGFRIGGGVFAAGARDGDLNNSFSVGGYARLDGMIGYRVNDNLEFSITGRNLTDTNYIATPVSRTENHPGAPRSFMASLRARF